MLALPSVGNLTSGFAAVLLLLIVATTPVAGATSSSTQEALDAGNEALVAGEYRAAARHFARASDTSFPAAYGLALARRGQDRLKASLDAARRAEGLATTAEERLSALDLIALDLHDLALHDASTGADDPRLAEAAATLGTALAIDDASAARYLLLATVLQTSGLTEAMQQQVHHARELGLTDDLRQRFAMLPLAERLTARHLDESMTKPIRLHTPPPQYTTEARRQRTQGVVLLQAVIDREGVVQEVRVLRPLPHGLTQSAIDTVKRWRFEPATLAGEPVDVYYNLSINFQLGL
ncbi:MAG: energy transducer TonB [Acidobacteriota bacterium]